MTRAPDRSPTGRNEGRRPGSSPGRADDTIDHVGQAFQPDSVRSDPIRCRRRLRPPTRPGPVGRTEPPPTADPIRVRLESLTYWNDGAPTMSTAVATEARRYTPEDLLAMPDEKSYELVDGRLVERNMGAESSRGRWETLFASRSVLRGSRPGARLAGRQRLPVLPARPRPCPPTRCLVREEGPIARGRLAEGLGQDPARPGRRGRSRPTTRPRSSRRSWPTTRRPACPWSG